MNDSVEDGSRNSGNLVLGALLVGLGVMFLAGQLFGFQLGRYGWPFFIIVPGLSFFVAMVVLGRGAAGLAIPGSIVTTVGLLLFYQNITGYWESWSYAWALIPASVGVGLMIQGGYTGNEDLARNGRRLATIGGLLFLGFAIFFESIFRFGQFWVVGQFIWPLLLIGLGLFILLSRIRPSRG